MQRLTRASTRGRIDQDGRVIKACALNDLTSRTFSWCDWRSSTPCSRRGPGNACRRDHRSLCRRLIDAFLHRVLSRVCSWISKLWTGHVHWRRVYTARYDSLGVCISGIRCSRVDFYASIAVHTVDIDSGVFTRAPALRRLQGIRAEGIDWCICEVVVYLRKRALIL